MPKTTILNEDQLRAIDHEDGPLMIIAGAGTGKTTVITQRIQSLITKKNISPDEILALTFTEKSATEMEERIDMIMPYGYTQMWISTFHSFCDRILRAEAIHIGLDPSYHLINETEAIMLMRKHLFEFDLKYFRPLGNPTKFLSGLLQHFSRLQDEDVSVKEYLKYTKKLNAEELDTEKTLELANAYKKYEELKINEGVMDFSDLISNTLKLFRTRKNILKKYQDKFKYILVDEFQDTNFAQNQLAILLAGNKKNITVVGDDDQAIYRWRGAAISNMIQFKKNFPKVKIITLNKNYRSSEEILSTSYTVIQQNNPDRLEIKEKVNKKLTSERKIKGEPIEFLFGQRVEDEAEEVVKKIQYLTEEKKLPYKDIAILVRANDHSQPFIRAMQRRGIPFQFLGPERLFHQEEVKNLIAYLKVLYNFEDSTSLYRVLSMPIFNLPARDIATILNLAKKRNDSLFITLEKIDKNLVGDELFLGEETKEKIYTIYSMISSHINKIPTETAGQILYFFLQDSGLLQKMISGPSDDNKEHENIAKFFDKLKTYEAEHEDASVFTIVDWLDLAMQVGEGPLASKNDWTENNAVNILTIHASKGLEFPAVFLVNVVSQRFPTRERSEQIPIPADVIKEILPEGDYHLQEERRLFYVGMTRAKDYLYITAANFYGDSKRERKISPFVIETFGENMIEGRKKMEKPAIAIQQSLLDWAVPDVQTVKKTMHTTPINYISYSQLGTFEICPLHYKLRYLLKIPGAPSTALSFGISVHSVLRDFYQQFQEGVNIQAKDVEKLLKKDWVNEGYHNKKHEAQSYEKALHIIHRYLTTQFNSRIDKPIGIETPFQIILKSPEKNMLKVGGRIDRIDEKKDGSIEIIDYKTGTNIPDEKELVKNLQLSIYALAAHEIPTVPFKRNIEDITLSLYYLEEEKKLITTRTKEQLEECKRIIFAKVAEIETSDFLCSHNRLCENCEYKMLCSTK